MAWSSVTGVKRQFWTLSLVLISFWETKKYWVSLSICPINGVIIIPFTQDWKISRCIMQRMLSAWHRVRIQVNCGDLKWKWRVTNPFSEGLQGWSQLTSHEVNIFLSRHVLCSIGNSTFSVIGKLVGIMQIFNYLARALPSGRVSVVEDRLGEDSCL